MTRRPPTADRRRRGLTVLELVSALALFILVLGGLLVALNAATDIWSHSTARNRSQLKARQALERLEDDLASAAALPQPQPDGAPPEPSPNPSSAAEPLFIVERSGADRTGLYFVRQRAPAEALEHDQLSLELVAYHWSLSNGLARYSRPLPAPADGRLDRRVGEAFAAFRADVAALDPPSNVLSAATVAFAAFAYQPSHPSVTLSAGQPAPPLQPPGDLRLPHLPDYVDLHLAFIDLRDGIADFTRTNYLTRRVTLPAAQASRLP